MQAWCTLPRVIFQQDSMKLCCVGRSGASPAGTRGTGRQHVHGRSDAKPEANMSSALRRCPSRACGLCKVSPRHCWSPRSSCSVKRSYCFEVAPQVGLKSDSRTLSFGEPCSSAPCRPCWRMPVQTALRCSQHWIAQALGGFRTCGSLGQGKG